MNEEIKTIHNKAISFYKEKKFIEAIQLWQQALAVNPQEIEVLYSMGIINFELKKYEESLEFLNKLLELSPGHYKAMLIAGTAYLKLRKFDKAEEFIQKSIEINPKQKLAYLNLGAIYSILKKFDDAIKMFEKVIEEFPDEKRAHLGLAKIYSITEETVKANSSFKKVIELDANGPFGNYAKKALLLSEGAGKDEKDLEQLYVLGYKSLIAGYYNDAIDKFAAYLVSRPKDHLVNFLMAQGQLRTGMLKDSFLSFKKAILNNPKYGLYYKELAILLDKIGKPRDVLEILAKSKELGKEDAVVCYLSGKNLLKMGEPEKAEKELEKAIKYDRNNIVARYELAKLLIDRGEADRAKIYLDFIREYPLATPVKEKAEKLSMNAPY